MMQTTINGTTTQAISPGIGIDVAPYQIASVSVDNRTPNWLYLQNARVYIPPYTVGKTVAYAPTAAQETLVRQSPTDDPIVSNATDDGILITASSDQRPPSDGTSYATGQITLTYGGQVTAPQVITGALWAVQAGNLVALSVGSDTTGYVQMGRWVNPGLIDLIIFSGFVKAGSSREITIPAPGIPLTENPLFPGGVSMVATHSIGPVGVSYMMVVAPPLA